MLKTTCGIPKMTVTGEGVVTIEGVVTVKVVVLTVEDQGRCSNCRKCSDSRGYSEIKR